MAAHCPGWWEAPHSLHRFCHQDFLPHIDPPIPRYLWVARQEETLALAQALQHCAERSGMPPTVLCHAAWDLQRCMVPLIHLDGDEIVETLLLGPTDNAPGTSPTPEEEAVLLGDEPECLEAQEATMCPKPEEPAEWLMLHVCLLPKLQHQAPMVTNLWTPEEPHAWLGLGIWQHKIHYPSPMSGSSPLGLKGMNYWLGGQSSGGFTNRTPGYSVRPRLKSWLRSRL